MIPKYVYHYTSIDTLKAILTSHKIRFTRLDLLNDPYEGDFTYPEFSHSQGEKRRLIYCSCWNCDENESVSLWHIYTSMCGARIKLKSSVFADKMYLEEQESGFVPVSDIPHIDISFGALGQAMETVSIKKVYGPLKIHYVDTFEDTYTNVVGSSKARPGTDQEFTMYNVDLRELGNKKVNHWEYEHEWRFKLVPFKAIGGSKQVMDTDSNIVSPKYVDVTFMGEIEEILLGPNVSAETRADLKTFLNEKGLTIQVKDSSIQYRGREANN